MWTTVVLEKGLELTHVHVVISASALDFSDLRESREDPFKLSVLANRKVNKNVCQIFQCSRSEVVRL